MKGRERGKYEVVRNDAGMTAYSYDLLTTQKRGVEMSNGLKSNGSYNLTTLTTKVRKGRGEGAVERFAREGAGRKDVRGAPSAAPASPCVAECALDLHTGWCRGCARTRAEIAAWRDMPAAERARVMEALPGRRGACGAVDGVGGAP